jgi:hypothetical protein
MLLARLELIPMGSRSVGGEREGVRRVVRVLFRDIRAGQCPVVLRRRNLHRLEGSATGGAPRPESKPRRGED